ncbi:hypothetical protein H112_08857 [Trichophyton rubrum D6]|nr:uncharacterized protein TERG_01408 [Trichophyton rubrum CBS 118892]EZF09834.1 hypothetical protein H100_08878 [Trichophyton rubrum MR850]EZF36696.1 hypothetical protein H102_08839 [Trichophyton rubrum CBS 100081]EZF47288.1 hypothetical protein H103_08861 [Trichophyton rubrum CBS 288.86]EZF58026.1 hypothetical protein H104_08809 [Trichophyton rubrum CBS 289.86]EZF79244.1 hypothetical protein H110_08862 [Trichophyton rubrum MR1448]EZF89843.1 hypothetical protein H113_08928 [Trichophyton rubr
MIMEKFELPITSSPVPSSSFSELTAVSAGTAEDLDRQSKERLGRYVAASERDNVVQLMDAFMKYLPKDGSVRLMQDVISLDEDEKLRQLKEHLVDAILKPIQAVGGRTPAPTPSPCHDSQVQIDSLMITSMNASSCNQQAKLKNDCLKRDGYRCQVTGLWDRHSVETGKIVPEDGRTLAATEVAHILPFSLGSFDEDKEFEVENKATIWQALYRYFPGLEKVITPDTINTPANSITLFHLLHPQFGSLNITFKETDQPYVYNIVHKQANYTEFSYLPRNGQVTFRCHDNSIVMPSPFLLSVHARIGKILQVSGLKERFEKIMRSLYHPSEVDPDGSTDLETAMSDKLFILTDV